jgi:hypothetical protein
MNVASGSGRASAETAVYRRRMRLFTRAMATLTTDSPAITPEERGTT